MASSEQMGRPSPSPLVPITVRYRASIVCEHLIIFSRLSVVRFTEAQTGLLPVQVDVSASVLAALI